MKKEKIEPEKTKMERATAVAETASPAEETEVPVEEIATPVEETVGSVSEGGEGAPSPYHLSQESQETQEPQEAQEAQAPQDSQNLEALLADAEQRGYLRGRNERIEQLMQEPAPFARQSAPLARQGVPSSRFSSSLLSASGSSVSSLPSPDEPESEPLILNNPRVSIWDR